MITVSTVFLTLMAVLAVLGTIAVLLSPEPLVIPVAVVALWFVHVAGSAWHVRWPPRRPKGNAALAPSADGTSKGIRFRYSRRMYYWFTMVVSLTMLVGLGIAALFTIGRSAVGIAFAVVMVAATLSMGRLLVVVLRHTPGEVTIAPGGIFQQSLTLVHFVPWYAIDEIEAEWLNGPVIIVKAYPSEDTVIGMFARRLHADDRRYLPFMVVRTVWLGTDPTTVYHALAYYHAHPELRPELGTPAALDRIAGGTAVVEQP
jgi:hypothetical protein